MNKNLALPEHMRHLAAGIVLAAALSGCARTAHMDTTVGSVVTPGQGHSVLIFWSQMGIACRSWRCECEASCC